METHVAGLDRGAFSIREMSLIEGGLPKRITTLVLEWAFEHRPELMEDWELSEERKPLKQIEPLV
ncbi:MAG: DUF4160 domain-containing protein [Deferrisomatales bacterium]|nr:DUF4160 domain-containing protein [Deferrisomatales bacterium]